MTIGEKIKSIRKQKGLTQKRLGELCSIDEANIRKYELGSQNPKLETLTKIAKALDIPVTDLISLEGIELRKENAGLEGLKSILECVYDEVELNWHKTINRDNEPEYNGEYDVFLKKGEEELYLTKHSYETLFKFVCNNIPVFIGMIAVQDDASSIDQDK